MGNYSHFPTPRRDKLHMVAYHAVINPLDKRMGIIATGSIAKQEHILLSICSNILLRSFPEPNGYMAKCNWLYRLFCTYIVCSLSSDALSKRSRRKTPFGCLYLPIRSMLFPDTHQLISVSFFDLHPFRLSIFGSRWTQLLVTGPPLMAILMAYCV